MTSKEINEIKARCEAATGRPWARKNGQIISLLATGDYLILGRGFEESDSEFIAHARQDVPQLLEYIEQLITENTTLKKRLEKAVELPCKKGDAVYWIENGISIKKAIARQFGYEDDYVWITADVGKKCVVLSERIIFHTREEAENALKVSDKIEK